VWITDATFRGFNGGHRMKLQSTVVNVLLLVALLLLLPFPSSAKSKLDRTQQSAISVISSMVVLSWVVVSPVLGISAAVESTRGGGDETEQDVVDRTKAGPRPPLKVTGVDPQANGDIHVAVEVVGRPGQHGVLNWPAREGNPAEALRTGDVLAFKPSDEGSGWLLNDQGGQSLAFLPTEAAQQSVMSTLW